MQKLLGHGREIAYEVKLEAGETPVAAKIRASFFVDGAASGDVGMFGRLAMCVRF